MTVHEWAIGFLYFAGCYLHWARLGTMETAMTILNGGEEVQVEPINKTVTTLVWPFMAVYGLVQDLVYGETEEDDE
jgi:hypothetical protein